MLLHSFEYESTDTSREEMKRKFAPTMEFVEEYLRDVVSQHFPFGDKDKNELTLEVKSHLPGSVLQFPLTEALTLTCSSHSSPPGGESGP